MTTINNVEVLIPTMRHTHYVFGNLYVEISTNYENCTIDAYMGNSMADIDDWVNIYIKRDTREEIELVSDSEIIQSLDLKRLNQRYRR